MSRPSGTNSRPGASPRFEATVTGMHCAGCVASIEKAVGGTPGVAAASVNLATGGLSVELEAGRAPDAALRDAVSAALQAAGDYHLAPEPAPDAPNDGRSAAGAPVAARAPVAAGAAIVLAGAAMALAMSPAGAGAGGRVLQALLAAPVVLWLGRGFFSALGSAVRRRAFGMDSLIGMGAGVAFAASTVQLLFGASDAPLFFDTAALIVAFVLLGRYFEGRARGRAARALDRLLAMAPDRARVSRGGGWEEVPVAAVGIGERVLVRPGERIPLDGEIARGGAALDEALVTGESVPVERTVGDSVSAGAMNLTGAIEVEVRRRAADSAVSRIARAVRKAQADRIPLQRAADRVAGVFVPAVMAGAGVTAAVWLAAGGETLFAVERAVAVLVVACPCALGLAVPTAVLVATGRSARRGILFRSGSALEGLARVRAVALDKTGTLTAGEPVVALVAPVPGVTREELLECAASAEQGSEHPLGVALVAFARSRGTRLRPLRRFEAIPGRGVRATLEDGAAIQVGSPRFARELGASLPPGDGAEREVSGRLVVLRNRRVLGMVGFRDTPRPEARELVRRLRGDGLAVALVSGDAPGAVAAAGAEVGIGRTEGGLLPEEKLAAVDRLRSARGPVAMVGDGINDAPALAHADVGIAFAEGTEVAREAAGVTVMRPDLRLVAEALAIARRAARIIRQNLFWAFLYNTAAIPLAAGVLYPATGVLLPPEAAAAAMALSSISVVGNALRLSVGGERAPAASGAVSSAEGSDRG